MCTLTCCPTWNESIIIFCFGLQVSCERLQAGSSSLITSSRGRGWTTCVAASSTDASGSRRLVRGAYLASVCNREEKWQIPRQSYESARWWREISWFVRRIANNFSICMSHLSHWILSRVLLSLTLTELFFSSFDWRGVASVGPSIWWRSVGRPPPTWVYLKLHCSRP